MDVNTLRVTVTVAAFALFLVVLVWAYLPTSKPRFDEAAQLPFQSD